MITIDAVTKRFRGVDAVDELSFAAHPGRVTALLGPNGAGKSTTLRVLLGLDDPDAGQALIDGHRYRDLRTPLTQVGALLDASWIHPRRSVRAHLRWVAVSNGIPSERIGTVLDIVGMSSVAKRPAGKLSLGMRQRVGLAVALLGDPGTIVLDEPANGLDPEGVRWIRALLRRLAGEGRTVLLSSHMLDEVAQIAEDVVVIAGGRLKYSGSVSDFTKATENVLVRAAEPEELRREFIARGLDCSGIEAGERGAIFRVFGSTERDVAVAAAAAANPVVFEISAERRTLESAFFERIEDGIEFRGRQL